MNNVPHTSHDAIVTPDNFNRAETDMASGSTTTLLQASNSHSGGLGLGRRLRELLNQPGSRRFPHVAAHSCQSKNSSIHLSSSS